MAACLLGGCGVRESEMTTRRGWEGILLSARKHPHRTNYDKIFNFDGTTRIDGYRLWCGFYRGVRIELYSCVLQQRYYSWTRGGIKYVAVLLTAWPGDAKGNGSIVAEKRYPLDAIDTSLLVEDPGLEPDYIQNVAAGRLRAEVEDRGHGSLAVRLNVQTVPEWYEFDVERLLKESGYVLSEGPRRVTWERPPVWDHDTFVRVMRERMRGFDTTGERWWEGTPRRKQIQLLDHPLWEDPQAVSKLLQSNEPTVVVFTLKFMRLKNYVDPFYVASLKGVGDDLITLGWHSDGSVRAAFAELLFRATHWPTDIDEIEPLLASDDPAVQCAVLEAFLKQGKMPEDEARLRALARSEDSLVASRARRMLSMRE